MARAHVLLVEDHADTRSMYAEYLGFDFDVSEAVDGVTALEHAMRLGQHAIVALLQR